MKIVGFVSGKKVLAEVSPEDLAGLMGFSKAYQIRDKVKGVDYETFKPEIIGTEIKVSSVFADASAALSAHRDALTSAEQLKKSASRFLGFFKDDK